MRQRDWIIRAGLAILTISLYARTATFDFTSFDDPEYVSANPRVRDGLSAAGVAWAFRTTTAANWHPLTWLSHMADVSVFGLGAGPPHAVNSVLHAVNALLLFEVLRRMTASSWPSAMVAALFAVHPLHVESVAWVAERKDVLSTTFFLLTLWSYRGYATRGGKARYIRTVGLMACGLMTKPMLVTLPLVMLLLDFWPLRRLNDLLALRHRVLEKIPMLALSLASGIVTFLAQRAGGAVAPVDHVGLAMRLSNAIVAMTTYLGAMLWPANLAVFYPYPDHIPAWRIAGSSAVLLGITVVTIRQGTRRPWLLVGWLWYLVTLLPVIGLVQVGQQAMADRYTYIPLIGPIAIGVWLAVEFADRARLAPWLRASAACLLLGAFSIAAWKQIGYWRDSSTLFARAIEATDRNWLAYNHLATARTNEGRLDEAIAAARESLRLRPSYAIGHFNLGNTLWKANRPEEALLEYQRATDLKPELAPAWNNAGVLLIQLGRLADAEASFQRAIDADPDYLDARTNLRRLAEARARPNPAPTTVP